MTADFYAGADVVHWARVGDRCPTFKATTGPVWASAPLVDVTCEECRAYAKPVHTDERRTMSASDETGRLGRLLDATLDPTTNRVTLRVGVQNEGEPPHVERWTVAAVAVEVDEPLSWPEPGSGEQP